MENKHQLTSDGSSTLYTDRFGETYHSRHGAIQESMHVFMDAGWKALHPKPEVLHILGMGFGTGLNALLAALQAKHESQQVHYTSLEAYPISKKEQASLNYGDMLDNAPLFEAMHAAPWDQALAIHPYFTLHKVHTKLEDYQGPSEPFSLIFYDAFAPNSQPELWTEDVFKKLHDWMHPGGILTTYCAKGAVRRAMIAAGFTAERIPGPPGKREMLRSSAYSSKY